jgi:hypothetical protein
VETPEQVQALRQLDIDIGQGYLLGKPLPLSDLGPRDRTSLAPSAVSPEAAPAGEAPILDGPYRLDGPPALDGRPDRDGRPSPLPGPGTDVTVLRPLQPRVLAITPG